MAKKTTSKDLTCDNDEPIPMTLINKLKSLSDDNCRKVVYAVDNGAKTKEEISKLSCIKGKHLDDALKLATFSGIIDRKIRKKENDFEDVYSITISGEDFIKSLLISLSNEKLKIAEEAIKKKLDGEDPHNICECGHPRSDHVPIDDGHDVCAREDCEICRGFKVKNTKISVP